MVDIIALGTSYQGAAFTAILDYYTGESIEIGDLVWPVCFQYYERKYQKLPETLT